MICQLSWHPTRSFNLHANGQLIPCNQSEKSKLGPTHARPSMWSIWTFCHTFHQIVRLFRQLVPLFSPLKYVYNIHIFDWIRLANFGFVLNITIILESQLVTWWVVSGKSIYMNPLFLFFTAYNSSCYELWHKL